MLARAGRLPHILGDHAHTALSAATLCGLLAAAPVAAADLKLATWNIAWLTLRPVGDPALPRSLPRRDTEDLERLAGYARRLDADVVALQEVDGPAAAARLFDPDVYTFFFAAEDDVQRTGFAVKRRLVARQNADLAGLDLRPQARLSLRRGTDITVQAGDAPLRLLSVHLSAGCREGGLATPKGEDCADLARQAGVLAGWIAARQRDGGAFAIMGDFNRRLGGDDDGFLRRLGPEPALTRPAASLSNPCWADASGGRPFVDHILLGPGAAARLLPESLRVLVYAERGAEWRDRLSDHCPVSVRLRGG